MSGEFILGLDIGVASIGWAIVEQQEGRPAGLRAAGVRVFLAGVEGDFGAGRDESRAAKRREARQRRRLLARRRQRLTTLAKHLQRAGLLPPGDLDSPEALLRYFAELDRALFPAELRQAYPHLLLYGLRARALEERLTPYEIGRALYHLSHRRGFLSNRRATAKEREEEEGVVKAAITELAQHMAAAGARTVGEYLARLDPEEERVRNRYLSRAMIAQEFEAIWRGQAAHHPGLLTEDLRRTVSHDIFYQRPLKTPKHLIGFCELEPCRRRAPLCELTSQRHRLLQKVNDLRFLTEDGRSQELTAEQRALLAEKLDVTDHLTFPALRKFLSLKGGRFNFETEGEKGLIGNRTAAKLISVFGETRWAGLTPQQRELIVGDLHSIHNAAARQRRGEKAWGLDAEAAARFAELPLEDGYHSLSRQALAKVLPLMEQGLPYATARQTCYADRTRPQATALLPPLSDGLAVRNPAVERALTELRKVVNAVIRAHGKPAAIRVELARDLKRNRKQRQDVHARNAANRRDRETAAEALREAGVHNPRRSDVEKWLLAEECRRTCPYTGRQISVEALFGDAPQFQVEHIIPFHRCLDDSFLNKTLCHVEENQRKGNRTPWEAYHGTEQWEAILDRVRGFRGGGRGRFATNPKLRRFQLEELSSLEDFTSQQLNDTRYASRLAVTYLAQLYGAGADGVDPGGRRRVQVGRGEVTAFLRDVWDLNTILGGGEKTRDDHRQHAIDAAAVALTDAAMVKRLSDAAAGAAAAHRRRFAPVAPPWPSFQQDLRESVLGLVVSHRISRKVAGAMHEETHYGRPRPDAEGRLRVHLRKPLASLSEKDLPNIVDPTVRRCVEEKLAALGERDPKKAFKTEDTHPLLRTRRGRQVPIHKVRLRTTVTTRQVGQGARARDVKLGDNHHVEIVETTDAKGAVKWEGVVVSTYQAMRRLREGQPVVQREHGDGKRFVFSLTGGEIVELGAETGDGAAAREFWVVRTISLSGTRTSFELARIADARQKQDIRAAGDWGRVDVDPLRKRHCRKVLVTPLGEVREAHD